MYKSNRISKTGSLLHTFLLRAGAVAPLAALVLALFVQRASAPEFSLSADPVLPAPVAPLASFEKKATAADGAAGDFFGRAVAIDGDTAIVGAFYDDDKGLDSGSAYIFSRNQGGTDNWGQVKKLTAADGTAGEWFGEAVAIDGDTVIVGAYHDDDKGAQSGSAYVFYCNQGGTDNWGQVAKLTAADGAAQDFFGSAVAIDGETAIVSALGDDDKGAKSGSAYVFQRNQGGVDNWGQVKKLPALDGAADDQFGWSVAIDGDTAVVGAVMGDSNEGADFGSAYVFSRNEGGRNNWGQVKKLTASDGAQFDFFGIAIAIDGNTAVVGASDDDDKGPDSGSAYVFSRNQGGADNWGEVQKMAASDGAAGDSFGWAVSVSGDRVIVGAPGDETNRGSAYFFSRNQGGVDNWGQVAKLTGSDGAAGDAFGESISLSGETALVGAPFDGDKGVDSGSAYFLNLAAMGAAEFANPQGLGIAAGPGEIWRHFYYDYTTGQLVDGPVSMGSATVDVLLPLDHWIGVFLYSFDTGRWEEAIWYLKANL